MPLIDRLARRPLQFITREEINNFMMRNRPFRQAWVDLAPFMRVRDQRGVKRWVFAMGWLACLAYNRLRIEEMAVKMAEKMVQEASKLSDEFAERTGLPE